MRTIHFINAIFKHEMMQVLRRGIGDAHQRTEIHQQAAVAVEHQHMPVGVGQRQPESVRRGLPHRPGGDIVQIARVYRHPVEQGLIHGDD